MDGNTRTALIVALSFASGILLTLGVQSAYQSGGFLKDSVDTVTRPPHSATKALFFVAFGLLVLALPLGVLEWASERRYLAAERALRLARPADAVARYEGPEGRGYLFDGPEGRVLLLEPPGMLGRPVRVDLPPVPAAPPVGQTGAGEVP